LQGGIKYDYGIVYTIADADNRSHSFAKKGNVWITYRDDVWHEESRQAVIAQQWRAIVAGDRQLRNRASVTADIARIFRELLESLHIAFNVAHSVLLFIV
jgi:hypothetical protein